jgi:hypothetical protein
MGTGNGSFLEEESKMGYDTEFVGEFLLDKALMPEHKTYLDRFAYTRRMKRNAELTANRPDPIREAVGLPVGIEGSYFVGANGDFGQEWNAQDILDPNKSPTDQPGLWCKWVPNDEGTAIEWSGAEKFCSYVEWIEYLTKHFLEPWGYKLNGFVAWRGEDFDDHGTITIQENKVSVQFGL